MKYVTIIDIANELGISKSTVSRALSGDTTNVKPDTLQLVLATAERMGYQRNEMAVNLRKQSTKTIGIIIPEVVTSFFMRFIQIVQSQLNLADYRLLIAASNEDPELERQNLLMFEQCRVEGIIISPCHNRKNIDLFKQVISHGTPIVFFDRTVDGIDASQVCIDDYIQAFFMVEELIRSGCRRIVHLAGPSYICNGVGRLRGYRDALEKFHLDYDPHLVIQGGLDHDSGAHAMAAFLAKGIDFDAVFGFTETSTIGAKSVLQKLHYNIPDDVALCCMSGTTLCTLVYPTISAVEQPVERMATEVCRLLLQKIRQPESVPEKVVLRGEMIIRGSMRQP